MAYKVMTFGIDEIFYDFHDFITEYWPESKDQIYPYILSYVGLLNQYFHASF